MISSFLGWLRKPDEWNQTVKDFTYLKKLVRRKLYYLLSGISTRKKFDQIQQALETVIFTNARCAVDAACHKLSETQDLVYPVRPFREDLKFYSSWG